MKSKWLMIILLVILMSCSISAASFKYENPRIGIVISKTSFEQKWGVTQMSAHGWAAVANLAGLPYDCLFLSDLVNADLSQYRALIFGQCSYVENDLYDRLISPLEKYLQQGGNVIIDGPFAVNDESARERDHTKVDQLFGIAYSGFHGDSDYRIKVKQNWHYISRMMENNQFVTQPLVSGLNILTFKEGGDVLLVSTNEREEYPFLSSQEKEKNRVILISDFSTWAGVASFFRNVQPQVFYANRIFDMLIRALHWTVYGDVQVPFPVPQLSNANLTAIIRLDADASGNLDAQVKTINYLVDIARESGVVPVYAWVSSQATKAGWQDLAPLGKKIEEVGGEIATHSKYHRINREMTEERWKEELDDAIREIEFNMSDYDYPIGKIEYFINPGNTIHMDDYEQIARRFSFYMTHGFEQDMALGYGNLTWFTGPYKNLVVLENVPSPDYQWFYDPTWSYTTQQITAYEEEIFDHMYQNIGRGVIFNEMWHDYSITSQPQYGKDRIMNKSNIAFYDAMKAKFATSDIYCPTPSDLGNKLRILSQWDYSWNSDGSKLTLNLDFSHTRMDSLYLHTGGMGIRIENTPMFIQNVVINGKNHLAFTDRLIILPTLQKGKNTLEITLGPNPSVEPHLTYISKPLLKIDKKKDDLEILVSTKSKAKFNFHSGVGYILLGADWQEWNRKGNFSYRGFVASDRKVTLKKLENSGFMIISSAVPISDIKENGTEYRLTLGIPLQEKREIRFTSEKIPKRINLDSKNIEIKKQDNFFEIDLPEFEKSAELVIQY